jgi:two-component system chemotaxis response regulator CheB
VHLAPLDAHLVVRPDGLFGVRDGRKIRFMRSSANPLFESAAASLHGRVLAVVLTGRANDATDGVQAVRKRGGTVIAQDQATSLAFSMPGSAIGTGAVDHVLPLDRIGPALVELVHGRVISTAGPPPGRATA